MQALSEIRRDIRDHHRRFLPGANTAVSDIANNLGIPVSVDGIDEEERQLILSTLPADARGIFLAELDKGLSGAKVYRLVYELKKGRSKPFVLKIGSVDKIRAEADRTVSFATPFIDVEEPIVRLGRDRGALIQNFAGVGDRSTLQSLRQFARANRDAAKAVRHLFKSRLAKWYFDNPRPKAIRFGAIFADYLRKGEKHPPLYPPAWSTLRAWVKEATGIRWRDSKSIVTRLKTRTLNGPCTIVHGDLHAQNVLIDEKGEPWPIDFAWTGERRSPVVDLVMLECSLKFLGIPARADLRELFRIERAMSEHYVPHNVTAGKIPYATEISNVLRSVVTLRELARDAFGFKFDDYLASLFMMTHALATHQKLNRPFVLASLQILSSTL